MSLKVLSNELLDQKLKSLVQQERELLAEILVHIAEVDRRKLYLKMAYSNLFLYLTEHLGYSAGSAQRRIDAARLMLDVPDLPNMLEAGDLSLAQVSLVQKSIRSQSKKISKEIKQTLIEDLTGLSLEASQKMVAQTLDLEIKDTPQIMHQKDESVRLEITLSREQWEKLKRMRELLSTSLPRGSWDEVLEYVADKVIQQKTKTKEPKVSEHVTDSKKKFVLKKDQCCQYEDPKTKRKCNSKWNLQVDHIHPKWDGGSNDLENLRILCANHNRLRYKEQTGISGV